jgi:FKBP-type peptidyl-prolyl cis-trans isomerase FkpA/FKBP-type peptidyl-prolyl cis-trans isomerase FklB
MVSLAACQQQAEPGANASLETADQKASYGIGRNIGQGLVPMAERIDVDAFARGLRDALNERDPAVSQAVLDTTLQTFQMALQEAQQQKMAEEAESNQAEADSFLATNAEREGVRTTDSGLQYEVIEEGDGPKPGPDDQVTVHYRGTLPDGTQFDSSYDRGEPATFGVQGVIPGFAEGLQLMSVGSKYKLYIPPDLGYGPRGQGPIPPNSTLIFELELLDIVN